MSTNRKKSKPEVVGYARVSTREQHLRLQIDAIKDHGVDRLVIEKQSGVKQRPKLEKLLKELRKDDTLVIWKLDRLGRSAVELISLSEQFTKDGINFVSITDRVDTTTPAGKMQFGLLALVAQMEREVLIERTRAGLDAARRAGSSLGRPSADPKKLARAFSLYSTDNISVTEISKITGIGRSTIYKYLKQRRADDEKGQKLLKE